MFLQNPVLNNNMALKVYNLLLAGLMAMSSDTFLRSVLPEYIN